MLKIILTFIVVLFLCVEVNATQPIKVYAYHQEPPFVINRKNQKGLNYDFVREMNQSRSNGARYELVLVSRPELNRRLKNGENLIVLWASPVWFKPGAGHSYLWTQPVFQDSDVVVSLVESTHKYTKPASLDGLTVGGRKGYYYEGVDQRVQQGKLRRVDVEHDEMNLQQLIDGRVDVVVISRSTLIYYANKHQWISRLNMSEKPLAQYKRQMLVTQGFDYLLPELNQIINRLNEDSGWNSRLGIYSLWPGSLQ